MGTMSFLLPPGLPADVLRELERACMAGGFDSAPAPTNVLIAPRRLTIRRTLDESGYLITPWDIEGVGRLMTSTSTLVERDDPYSLAIELARGKVHHVRNHLADWRALGFVPAADQDDLVRGLCHSFSLAATETAISAAERQAQSTLCDAFQHADNLVQAYSEHVFAFRHLRLPRLETSFASQLTALPPDPSKLAWAFNSLRLALTWRDIEPVESQYHWDDADAVVDWAEANNMPVTAGPLLDFSRGGLPEWLWLWEGDLANLANFMCDYVETVISRYRGRIRRWLLTAAGNFSSILSLGEDDMLWLTARLAEAAQQIAPEIELVVGVSQPWGEYLARDDHTYTPFYYLDTLLRAGLRLAALDVEMVMGISPRGSYCRDLLEANRLLDGFAALSTPVQVTLAVPSSEQPDEKADSEFELNAGRWIEGFTPDFQASWAARFAALALSKPYVAGVCWAHLSDALPHRFPHCGLLDAQNQPKPALERLRQLRQAHVR